MLLQNMQNNKWCTQEAKMPDQHIGPQDQPVLLVTKEGIMWISQYLQVGDQLILDFSLLKYLQQPGDQACATAVAE